MKAPEEAGPTGTQFNTFASAAGASASPGSNLDEHASETQLAELLQSQLPPLRCLGKDWFVYKNGVWEETSRDEFSPLALSIQNSRTRTADRTTNILRHVELANQTSPKGFRSFHFEENGEIFINCSNRVLAVSRDRVRQLPHSETYLFTRQMAAKYDLDASAPTFEKVLQEVLPDPADIQLFRCFAGYILMPDCRHEAALVCYGETGTGKGTISTGIEASLGDGLITAISLSQLSNPENKNLAKLTGAALNLSCELEAVEVTSEIFKQLVSGEAIECDRKYRDSISLRSSCKLWFSANHLPKFKSGTDAELRRLYFLRFDNQVQNRDETLKARIRQEADGVLLIMLDGLRHLLQVRKFPPGGIKSSETRARFKIQNNPLKQFVETECALSPTLKIRKPQLYQAYGEYCEANSVGCANDSWFFRELSSRYSLQCRRANVGGERFHEIVGIALNEN